ncbi:MAG: serine hydrolase domain-containing protein [Candidatus Paceibacterota bacterium]|jgi:CubicO group peptidase (beta-lactamase class C family)
MTLQKLRFVPSLEQIERDAIELSTKAIKDKLFPGCVIGIMTPDGKFISSAGSHTYDANAVNVTEDSMFDISSLTKAVVSSTCLHLIDRGMLSLETKVQDILPEFEGQYADEVDIKHLLTFTVELAIDEPLWHLQSGEAILDRIMTAGLKHPPGQGHFYHNSTSIILGKILEEVTGFRLDFLLKKFIFSRLGMHDTTFCPRKNYSMDKIVPTENDTTWRMRLLHGEVHDEISSCFSDHPIAAAGLFSTVPDLMKFASFICNNKWPDDGSMFLPERSYNEMVKNHLASIGRRYGLGWDKCDDNYICPCFSSQTIVLTGFSGCSMHLNPMHRIAVVILSNAVHPKRHPGSMFDFRRTINQRVFYCKHCMD